MPRRQSLHDLAKPQVIRAGLGTGACLELHLRNLRAVAHQVQQLGHLQCDHASGAAAAPHAPRGAYRMRRGCSASMGQHLLRRQPRCVLRVKVLKLLKLLVLFQVLCKRTALQHRTSQAPLAPSSFGPASDRPGDLPASSISTIDSDSCIARALAELRRDAGRESLAVRSAACRPPLPGLLVASGKLLPCAGLSCEAGRPAEALSNIPCIVLFCGLPSHSASGRSAYHSRGW